MLHTPDHSLFSVALDGSVAKLDISPKSDIPTLTDSDSRKCPVLLWSQHAKFPIFSTPIINKLRSNAVLAFVVNVKGCVFIYDYLNDGNVLWTHDVEANVFFSPILLPCENLDQPSVDIVFGAQNKSLYRFSIKEIMVSNSKVKPPVGQNKEFNSNYNQINFDLQWDNMLEEPISSTPTAFLSASNCICPSCNNQFNTKSMDSVKIDENLMSISSATMLSDLSSDSQKLRNSLYIASVTRDGLMNITCAKSGAMLKRFKLGHNIFSSPVIVNEYIVIGNRENLLTCFQLKNN